jgi:hypothetical protein
MRVTYLASVIDFNQGAPPAESITAGLSRPSTSSAT